MNFSDILSKVQTDSCIINVPYDGVEIFNCYYHNNSLNLFFKIIKESRRVEFKYDVISTLQKASNFIAINSRMGSGNLCIMTNSFKKMIFRESESLYDPKCCNDNELGNDFEFLKFKCKSVLKSESPICIMMYNNDNNVMLDGCMGLYGNSVLLNPDWKNYCVVIVGSEFAFDDIMVDIGCLWNVFIGDKK